MSSFIVENQTINNIVSWLSLNGRDFPYLAEKYEREGYYIRAGVRELKKLANAFRKMNERAVLYRYNDLGNTPKFKYHRVKFPGPLQVYKNICCLLYQCDEGKVKKSKLYELLELTLDELSSKIINDLPRYKYTTWG